MSLVPAGHLWPLGDCRENLGYVLGMQAAHVKCDIVLFLLGVSLWPGQAKPKLKLVAVFTWPWCGDV